MIDAATYGSSTSSISRGNSAGLCTSSQLAVLLLHAVRDVRRGHEQVEVELALEPLADDLHVQQAEEAAAEAEAERLRRLGLVHERGVVELEPLERVAELGIVVRVGREEPGEDHRLDVLVAGQGLFGRPAHRRERVADAEPRDVLQPGHDVADLAGREPLDGGHGRGEDAELLGVEAGAGGHRPQRLAGGERAVHDPDEGDDTPVLVVGGVEDERAGGRVEVAGRRGHPLDDRVEDVGDAVARLGGDAQHVGGVVAEQIGNLHGRPVRVGCGEVDLVRDGDDLEPVLDREVGVRERLRLDALRGVDHEQRPLAGLQRARDLVGEVDMPGRVDEVELVALPGDADGLGLDRDAALPLELHRVEDLLAHLAGRDRVGELEDAVRERRLAVVDVRDDREVADVALVHPAGDGTGRPLGSRSRRPAVSTHPTQGGVRDSLRPRDRR